MVRPVWYVYYGTRGYAGNYIHAVMSGLREIGVSCRAFVSAHYRFVTAGVVKTFFPITDGTERRNAFIRAIRGLELVFGYTAIMLAAVIARPRINVSLIDDTLVTYLFFRGCRLFGLDVDVTCHDVWTHDGALPFRRRKIFRMASRLVVHSSNAAEQLRALDPSYADKIIRMPFPFCFDALSLDAQRLAEAKRMIEETAGVDYCLFLGVVRRSKGIEDLLDAWVKTEAATGRKLVIAGKWSRLDWGIRDRARETRNCVLVDGYVTDEEFSALLDGAAFVVLPYREYTHSSVYFACAERGTLALVSDVRLFNELNATYALKFERGNAEALARAIGQAFALDPEGGRVLRDELLKTADRTKRALVDGLRKSYA